jgi:YVTN family beta-propeller protein
MNLMIRNLLKLVLACLVVSPCAAAYLSPEHVAVLPDGHTIAITAATSAKLLLFDAATNKLTADWPLPCNPTGVAAAADGTVFITGGDANGQLLKLDAAGKIVAQVATGHSPRAPVVSQDGKTVYVLNRFNNNVVAVDAATMTVKATVAVPREPFAAALGDGGRLLFVANLLPTSRATDNIMTAAVSVIDTATFKMAQNVALPNGSTGVRGIASAPDGKFVYVTHILGRYQLPTTQLERGWMTTAGLSVFDGRTGVYVNTVLLDNVDRGAANPWGVAVSRDGKWIVVTHAGTREISAIDRAALHARLKKAAQNKPVTEATKTAADVPNDLAFLVGIRRRVAFDGDGPRGIAVVGQKAYAAAFFSAALAEVNLDVAATAEPPMMIPLGPSVDLSQSPKRRGEKLWNDATICFQQWLSCASCHPDGRMDALNWDLLNDGIGNPKNTRSMLLAFQSSPVMALGVRKDVEAAVRSGITHIEFAARPEEEAAAIDAYIKSLQPISSPHLIDGRLSPAADRGRKVFFDQKIGCSRCHPEPSYLDNLMHDVGVVGPTDRPTDKFTTPSLREVWRTAPYLHDGRYLTIKELIIRGKHGGQSGGLDGLSEQQINDLAEFVLSL